MMAALALQRDVERLGDDYAAWAAAYATCDPADREAVEHNLRRVGRIFTATSKRAADLGIAQADTRAFAIRDN